MSIGRLLGTVAHWIHQPRVMGQFLAGILIGPSVLGFVMPTIYAWLFPQQTQAILSGMSEAGIAAFMFLVGTKFRTDLIQDRVRSAATISIIGFIVPFAIGLALGAAITRLPNMYCPGVRMTDAAIFFGACLAITAFPMLACIIHERRLVSAPVGALALTAGAVGDAVAWLIITVIIARLEKNWHVGIERIAAAATYGLIVLTFGRRCLLRVEALLQSVEGVKCIATVLALSLVALVAYLAQLIGMHSAFGTFVLGIAMPRGPLIDMFQSKLGWAAVTLLLPLFFAFSGLNTRLDLVFSGQYVFLTFTIVAIASVAKGGACWASARLSGEPPRTALALGALMNARGVMELILLNIGLQRGIITPVLYSMLVAMTLATTLMASPLFEFFYPPDALLDEGGKYYAIKEGVREMLFSEGVAEHRGKSKPHC